MIKNRCPKCGVTWYWEICFAYEVLVIKNRCPKCGVTWYWEICITYEVLVSKNRCTKCDVTWYWETSSTHEVLVSKYRCCKYQLAWYSIEAWKCTVNYALYCSTPGTGNLHISFVRFKWQLLQGQMTCSWAILHRFWYRECDTFSGEWRSVIT